VGNARHPDFGPAFLWIVRACNRDLVAGGIVDRRRYREMPVRRDVLHAPPFLPALVMRVAVNNLPVTTEGVLCGRTIERLVPEQECELQHVLTAHTRRLPQRIPQAVLKRRANVAF